MVSGRAVGAEPANRLVQPNCRGCAQHPARCAESCMMCRLNSAKRGESIPEFVRLVNSQRMCDSCSWLAGAVQVDGFEPAVTTNTRALFLIAGGSLRRLEFLPRSLCMLVARLATTLQQADRNGFATKCAGRCSWDQVVTATLSQPPDRVTLP